MDELEEALEYLRKIFELYEIRGEFSESEVGADFTGLPLSPELKFYFGRFSPKNVKIDTGMSPFKLFGGSDIKRGQLGYRWKSLGADVSDIEGWPSDYLVFADDFGGGKPVIADTKGVGTPVLASYEGVRPFKIAQSLAGFFRALGILIDLVYGEYEVFEVSDDDEVVKEDFRISLIERVGAVLGEENAERFYDYFYG